MNEAMIPPYQGLKCEQNKILALDFVQWMAFTRKGIEDGNQVSIKITSQRLGGRRPIRRLFFGISCDKREI